MGWTKRGLIFSPQAYKRDWMVSHAAVPFAQPLGAGRYRVYFSSRDGHNRSHVGYAEVDMNAPGRILAVSEQPVLAPGKPGTFDDAGAMLSWITPVGEQQYMYYIGWNLGVSVPFRNAIGLARGKNGAFVKFRNAPILDRSLYDPAFTASCCVLREGDDDWKMWYLSCIGWDFDDAGTPQHRYHIKYATSSDGIHWQRDGHVAIDFASPAEYAISRPTVIKQDGVYRMWFSCRGDHYRIGYATSADGKHWHRQDHVAGMDVSEAGWDSEMVEYPHVFWHDGQLHMLYNGNDYGQDGFGYAVWTA